MASGLGLRIELRKLGLEVHRDTHTFDRWEAKSARLYVSNAGLEATEIPVLSPYPYSGRTPAEGVSGELAYCGKGPGNFKRASGKIALLDVASAEKIGKPQSQSYNIFAPFVRQ